MSGYHVKSVSWLMPVPGTPETEPIALSAAHHSRLGELAPESGALRADTAILLQFSEGPAKIRFWTTDLTAEYVRLNSDYHT